MAELSGFRRFSYPGIRRQSVLPRNSLVSVATTAQTTGHSWLYILRAMQKQTLSLWPGFGLCICAVIVNNYFYHFDTYDSINDIYDRSIQSSTIDILIAAMYFVGACIGSLVCGAYQYTWPARWSNYVIGGILVISCGFMFWINSVAFCIARFLAGFSYGFIYIALTTHIADNVMKTVRGYIATTFSVAITLGYALGLGFSENSWKTVQYMEWIFNVALISFPIAALILTRFVTYEPVTMLLKMDLEAEARNILHESRKGLIDASVIQYEIDERKLMLIEDYDNEEGQCRSILNVCGNGNIKPILLMVLLRILSVFTSNVYFFILSALSIYRDLNFIIHLILMATRILVLMIPKYSIDKLGRRNLLLASGLGSGLLLLPFAAKHMDYISIRDDLLAIITVGIHIFAALGIEPVQHIYAAEAFPLSKRNGSLAIVTCIEYIFQGFITTWVMLGQTICLQCVLLMSPFAVLLLTIILFIKLPETRSLPLRKCRDQFNDKIEKKTLPMRASSVHTLGGVYM